MSAQAFDSADTIRAVGTFNVDTTTRDFWLSAVAIRHGASTCIRSQRQLRNHNRYSREPKPEAAAGDQTTTGLLPAINLPGRQPPYRTNGKLDNLRRLGLQRGSFGNDAVFGEAPQAIASLRARATMPTLRPRIPLSPKRSCHH